MKVENNKDQANENQSGENSNDYGSFFILNKIHQYGSSGLRFTNFIGLFDSHEKAQEQMNFFQQEEPSTQDDPYFFEIISCPLNQIGKFLFSSVFA